MRHADLKGYSFSREDVDARSLANQYAQSLGQVFTHEMKPMEVEILVAEIASDDGDGTDRMFHILYDGTVVDKDMSVVLGGETGTISDRFGDLDPTADLGDGLRRAVSALSGPDRSLTAADLEVAVLERGIGRRAFRRLDDDEVEDILDTD